jgi:DEAD/DEAH box helicase domain-containing protein
LVLGVNPSESDPEPGVLSLQRNVLWLNFLMIPPDKDQKELVEQEINRLSNLLPVEMQPPVSGAAPAFSIDTAMPKVFNWWPLAYTNGVMEGWKSPGLVLFDDLADQQESDRRFQWRRWLALMNQEQFLPGMLMATSAMLNEGACAGWMTSQGAEAPQHSGGESLLSNQWLQAIEQTLVGLQTGSRQLAAAQAPVPLIGHELADKHGDVVAEAEMAWPAERLVLLTTEQEDMKAAWHAVGWNTLLLSEDLQNVGDEAWWQAVARSLNVHIEGVSS